MPELPREFVPLLSILAIVLSGLRTRVHTTNARFWPILIPLDTSPSTCAPLSISLTFPSAEYTSRLTWHDTMPACVVSSSVFVPHGIMTPLGNVRLGCASSVAFATVGREEVVERSKFSLLWLTCR